MVRHITKRRGGYMFTKQRAFTKHQFLFPTLEEAIAYKERYLSALYWYDRSVRLHLTHEPTFTPPPVEI